MIAVNGYPAIPIVTGPKDEAPETGDQTADAVHARSLVTLAVRHFPNGAIRADLERQSGMKPSTFYRAHSYAVENGWLVKRDKLYNFNPTAPWDRTPLETPSTLPPTLTSNLHPYRGVEVDEGKLGTSTGGELEVSWRLKARESGEKADTTASAEMLNESVVPSDEESDLIVDALEQIKQRTA